MKKWNSSLILFSFMIYNSLMISISSSSFMGIWIGLELNLISVIPVFISKYNSISIDSTIKYFIIQALSSSIMLFFPLIITSLNNKMNEFSMTLFYMSILLKMGASPLHFWFPMVMEGLSWSSCFVLMTVQKIVPVLMMLLFYNAMVLIMFAITSIIMGAMSGINQFSLRKIMSFSSINHLGWILLSTYTSLSMLIMYFGFYLIINMNICLNLKKMNLNLTSQMFFLSNYSTLAKMMIFLSFISIAGIPPMMGFFPKLFLVSNLIQNKLVMIAFISVMFSLITMFFYTRLCYSSLLIYSNSLKQKKKTMTELNKSKLQFFFNTFTNLMMMIFFLMYIF